MMYSNKLAVALKTGNRVLREIGDTVYLPFGSEYSLFIKNLNNVRASVNISIDGDDIADGQEFVIHGNDSIDIERFLRSGNLSAGNRFKFIERTAGIEAHRGVGVEDGLVRVEYRFEKKPRVTLRRKQLHSTNTSYGMSRSKSVPTSWDAGQSRGVEVHDGEATMDMMDVTASASGITTEGSISNQGFQQVASFPLEAESHVMVLKLMGETEDNRLVSTPVTTRTKPVCNKCDTQAPAYNAQFCGSCGTSLQLVS